MLGIVEARSTGSPNEVQILIFILNCKTVAFMVNPRNFKTSKSKGEKYNGRAYTVVNTILPLPYLSYLALAS
jgi:hypothetical protein